jgi:hypothetical protein
MRSGVVLVMIAPRFVYFVSNLLLHCVLDSK